TDGERNLRPSIGLSALGRPPEGRHNGSVGCSVVGGGNHVRRVVLSACAVLAGVIGSAGIAAASSGAVPHVSVSSWTLDTSPLQTSLSDVSCAGSSFCAAVGPLNFANGATSGLALWN